MLGVKDVQSGACDSLCQPRAAKSHRRARRVTIFSCKTRSHQKSHRKSSEVPSKVIRSPIKSHQKSHQKSSEVPSKVIRSPHQKSSEVPSKVIRSPIKSHQKSHQKSSEVPSKVIRSPIKSHQKSHQKSSESHQKSHQKSSEVPSNVIRSPFKSHQKSHQKSSEVPYQQRLKDPSSTKVQQVTDSGYLTILNLSRYCLKPRQDTFGVLLTRISTTYHGQLLEQLYNILLLYCTPSHDETFLFEVLSRPPNRDMALLGFYGYRDIFQISKVSALSISAPRVDPRSPFLAHLRDGSRGPKVGHLQGAARQANLQVLPQLGQRLPWELHLEKE